MTAVVLQFVSGSKKRTATKELKGEAQTDWSGVRRTQGVVADMQEAYSDSELQDPTYYPSGLRPRTKSNTKMSHKKSRREDTEDVEQAGDWSF